MCKFFLFAIIASVLVPRFSSQDTHGISFTDDDDATAYRRDSFGNYDFEKKPDEQPILLQINFFEPIDESPDFVCNFHAFLMTRQENHSYAVIMDLNPMHDIPSEFDLIDFGQSSKNLSEEIVLFAEMANDENFDLREVWIENVRSDRYAESLMTWLSRCPNLHAEERSSAASGPRYSPVYSHESYLHRPGSNPRYLQARPGYQIPKQSHRTRSSPIRYQTPSNFPHRSQYNTLPGSHLQHNRMQVPPHPVFHHPSRPWYQPMGGRPYREHPPPPPPMYGPMFGGPPPGQWQNPWAPRPLFTIRQDSTPGRHSPGGSGKPPFDPSVYTALLGLLGLLAPAKLAVALPLIESKLKLTKLSKKKNLQYELLSGIVKEVGLAMKKHHVLTDEQKVRLAKTSEKLESFIQHKNSQSGLSLLKHGLDELTSIKRIAVNRQKPRSQLNILSILTRTLKAAFLGLHTDAADFRTSLDLLTNLFGGMKYKHDSYDVSKIKSVSDGEVVYAFLPEAGQDLDFKKDESVVKVIGAAKNKVYGREPQSAYTTAGSSGGKKETGNFRFEATLTKNKNVTPNYGKRPYRPTRKDELEEKTRSGDDYEKVMSTLVPKNSPGQVLKQVAAKIGQQPLRWNDAETKATGTDSTAVAQNLGGTLSETKGMAESEKMTLPPSGQQVAIQPTEPPKLPEIKPQQPAQQEKLAKVPLAAEKNSAIVEASPKPPPEVKQALKKEETVTESATSVTTQLPPTTLPPTTISPSVPFNGTITKDDKNAH